MSRCFIGGGGLYVERSSGGNAMLAVRGVGGVTIEQADLEEAIQALARIYYRNHGCWPDLGHKPE